MSAEHDAKLAWPEARRTLIELQSAEVDAGWYKKWSDALNIFNDGYVRAIWGAWGNTQDEAAKAQLSLYNREIKPELNSLDAQLTARSAAWEPTDDLMLSRVKRHRQDVKFANHQAVELDKEIDVLVQEYEEILSKLVLDFEGPKTLAQVRRRWREERDRSIRFDIWEKEQELRASIFARTDEIFVELFNLRQRKAEACGFESTLAYTWAKQRRDGYSPADALKIVEYVHKHFASIQQRRLSALQTEVDVSPVRPWDQVFFSKEVEPAKPFDEAMYTEAVVTAFAAIDPLLGEQVSAMAARGGMDLLARPTKASRNFSTVLCGPNEGLVFCSGTGDVGSLRVMMHETGHALHHEHAGADHLMFERVAPREILEFVAYSFQFLAIDALAPTAFLSASAYDELQAFVADTLLDVLDSYAANERFSHAVYGAGQLPAISEVDQIWLDSCRSYGVDWRGFESVLAKKWQHGHIISSPLYTFDYVAAYLGMLLFIKRYREDPKGSTARLLELLRYGGTLDIKESFKIVGIDFPFSEEDVMNAAITFQREFLN